MSIHGFYGPMFARKSTELMREMERARYAKRSAVLVKPSLDDRYSLNEVCTHSGMKMDAMVVPASDEGVRDIANLIDSPFDVIGLDEVQFYPRSLVAAVVSLSDAGKRVFCAGLDTDYMGRPFGPVPMLMAVGGVTKVTAMCACGSDATMTNRLDKSGPVVVIGAEAKYSALCRSCWLKQNQVGVNL